MIKSLSPYYLEVPLIAPISLEVCTSFTLQIFVWDGLKNDPPTDAVYEITKDNPTGSSGSEKINIALLVNDYIDFTPNFSDLTELTNGLNQRWVKTQILYTTSNPIDYVANYEQVFLMTQGYGYGLQGENPQIPANNILLQGTEFKVNRTGKFVFPFLIQQPSVDTPEIVLESVVFDDSEPVWKFIFTFTYNFTVTNFFAQNKTPLDPDFSGDIFSFSPPSPYEYPFEINVTPTVGLEYRIRAFDIVSGTYIISNAVTIS